MINQVALTGRLVRDVEVKYTQGGTAVASFTLAVDRRFTNTDGERESDFINCTIWRKSAETLGAYTHKGSLIGVQGRIQTRSYDNKDGLKVFVTEVVVDDFSFLERNGDDDQHQQSNQQRKAAPATSQHKPASAAKPKTTTDPFAGTPDPFAHSDQQIDISDDDLPF